MNNNSDNEKSFGTKIEEVALGTLGVGLGLSAVYLKGGNKLLSEGINKASKLYKEINYDVANKALKDVDFEGIVQKHLLGDNSTLNKLKNEKAYVEFDENGKDLFNVFKQYLNFDINPEQALGRLYNARLSTDIKNELAENFGKGDRALEGRIYNFVDDVRNHFDQITEKIVDDNGEIIINEERLGKAFTGFNVALEEQKEMFNHVLRRFEEADDVGKFANSDEGRFLIENMKSKLLDYGALEKQFGSTNNKTGSQKFMDRVVDNAATLRDVLNEKNGEKLKGFKQVFKGPNGVEEIDLIKELNDFTNLHPEFLDLHVGGSYRRTSGGEVYSLKDAKNTFKTFMDEAQTTIPGKLFKLRDVIQNAEAPTYRMWTQGEHDFVLGETDRKLNAEASKIKKSNTLLNHDYVKFYDKVYRINGSDLTHLPELDNTYLISGRHGTEIRLMKEIAGDTDYLATRQSKLSKKFDIFSSTDPNKISELKSFVTKFTDPDWMRNTINSFLYTDINEFKNKINDKDYVINYLNRSKKLNSFFANTTKKLDTATVKTLKDSTHGNAKRMFSLLELNDNDMLHELSKMSDDPNLLSNPDLTSLVKKYINDPRKAMDTLNIKRDKWLLGGTSATHFGDIVRREVAKEGFIQHVYKQNDSRYNSLYELFNSSGLTGNKLKEAKHLGNWAIFQKTSNNYHFGMNQKEKMPSLDSIRHIIAETQQLFSLNGKSYDGEFIRDFRKNLKDIAKDNAPVTERGVLARDKEIIEGNQYGNWTLMRKKVSALDALKNINDSNKLKAYAKQWTAGRNNMENVTTATLFPYFSILRLVDPLSQIGLGLSSRSTGSVKDLMWNIGAKRILPLVAGVTAYNYLDYRTKAYTGTSMTGAFANGIANANLALHKTTDVLHLTNTLKDARQTNVISQYANNKRDYMTYDEKKQFYQGGYVPVRSGRWWSFGSSSEWRGGKIDYFQPNFLIRTHADWYDNSVYGSSDEKWKHSWIPTPRHPLSTIRAMMDPYWLERKHYWDRPYPLTGKMFEENTPWGPLLNATVGEIIKPQKRMHKSELGRNLIDVRDLIEKRNKDILTKATQNSSLVRINPDYNIEPVSFSPLQAPNNDNLVYNYKVGNNKVEQLYSGGFGYKTIGIDQFASMEGAEGKTQIVKDKINLKADEGNMFAQAIQNFVNVNNSGQTANKYLSSMNSATFIKAARQPKGSIVADPIFNYRSKGDLYDPEILADLKNTSNSKEAMEDSWYSAKEIVGMYGFMINSVSPANQRHRLANASQMSSFAKRFWDNAIGGYGGEFMEIARRFFPHEEHEIERINPLRNTMPDWMPEKFQHGDPYSSIPKGDMRLPGKGYESVYALHSDQFGRYGAYDRMKILADIAPWSKEYKLWRQIATQTVRDPQLKNQMKNIKERVIEQSKKHDFYDYKFIGSNNLDSQKAIVDKVISSNEFTVIGSSKVYKMAGIKIKQDKEGNALNKYLQPGMQVILKTNKDFYIETKNKTTKSINAVVFKGGENLNRELLKDKSAEATNDESPAGITARFGSHGIARGRFFEAIGHAPIPFIHNKFMRIESPMESWQRTQIYGKSYSTWGHPIQGFIMPSLHRQWSYGLGLEALSIGSFYLAEQIGKHSSKGVKTLAYGMASLLNPAAVMGGTVGFATKLNGEHILKGARIGQAIGMAGYAYTHLDKPVDSIISFGAIGAWTTKYILKNKGLTEGKGAVVGAGVGLALSSLKNPRFDKEKMFGAYIPKDRRKQWEIEEYYDRLKYVKYMGLYNKAARKAKSKEHVDIKKIMNKLEIDRKKMQKKQEELLLKANKISNMYSENDKRREYYLERIRKEMKELKGKQTVLAADKYTKSAIAYKFAAESTIYGLKENATWSQILRALPKNNRDYFLEFAKENDPKKRKKILKYVSPYQRKVLKIAWGEKYKEEESNHKYFKKKFLPGTFWSGWQPDVNLDNVEIKEIKNEGMMLSDFGFYESQAQTSEARNAPKINRDQEQSALQMQKNLITSLNGAGLNSVDVSIEPSDKPGIQMIANIIRTNNYNLKSKINNALGNPFYS